MNLPFGASRKACLRFLLLAWALPAILTYLVYYAAINYNSGNVFSSEAFASVYDQGIFNYRVLGKFLLRATHEAIVTFGLPTSIPAGYQSLHPGSTPEWYSAFFYLNVIALGVTMSIYFVILTKLNKTGNDFAADLCLAVLMGIMVFSQYVIVPYDILSYLFQAAAIYLILFRRGGLDTLFYLCAIIIFGALTRETVVLILSFYAAVNFDALIKFPPRLFDENVSRPSPILTLSLMVACFLGTYIALRMGIESDRPLFESLRFNYNMASQFSLFGLAYFVVAAVALLIPDDARKTVALFLIAAAPYIVAIMMISNPREIRIWAPVLMPMIALQFQAAMAKPAEQ